MARLNQIVSVEKRVKADANLAITAAYHAVQKPELFSGISRTYEPVHEDGETLPSEGTKVLVQAETLLADTVRTAWTRLLDLTLTKDQANSNATADVRVGERLILAGAPVTFLIWLEKQLVDMTTMVGKLPTLDEAFDWEPSKSAGVWATPVTQTVKTKKVPRNHVKAEATDKHPAQVEIWHEDIKVGTWSTTKFSGAIPAKRRSEMLDRLAALTQAVKFAREEANGLEVTDRHVGDAIFGYLLA